MLGNINETIATRNHVVTHDLRISDEPKTIFMRGGRGLFNFTRDRCRANQG